MGGCFSKSESSAGGQDVGPVFDAPTAKERPTKAFAKPKWKADPPLTLEELQKKREEFWDTQPHYGGDRIIWDALKAACEADDFETTKLLLESAGIIVSTHDMTTCYDERGAKYELPKYVISNPTNLVASTA